MTEVTRSTGTIVVEGLTKRFGDLTAVNGLSLTIPEGEVFGLLGPNGAGKTTTIRMLSALIAPSSGEASVAGFKVGEQDTQIRRNVGILTESPGLYNQLSAERNLGFFAELYEVEHVAEQVEKYLRMLGLWDRRHEAVGTFSKGEPKVLFLDEPTSGLDPEVARLVRDFISELKHEGRTTVICTHNLDEADRLCDRIAVFKSHLLALDTPTALRRQLYGRTVVFHLEHIEPRFVQAVEDKEFVRSIKSMENKLVVVLEDPETQNSAIVRMLVELGADIQFVGELRRTLEDVYLRLMKGEADNEGRES
jgi:ABC-2 type transport system ATP-binding protein